MASEDGEMWDKIHKDGQEKRARNRQSSAEIIREWARENNGMVMTFSESHLRINERYDFWPGTGKFLDRATGKYYRGVFNLIRALKK